MTDRILPIADYIHHDGEPMSASLGPAPADDGRFLIEEGLQLLASYRSITDRHTRLRLNRLVQRVALRRKAKKPSP